jgi:hypothetical protein
MALILHDRRSLLSQDALKTERLSSKLEISGKGLGEEWKGMRGQWPPLSKAGFFYP